MLRVHDHEANDLAGRLDGNPVAGRIPVHDLLQLMQRGLEAFRKKTG